MKRYQIKTNSSNRSLQWEVVSEGEVVATFASSWYAALFVKAAMCEKEINELVENECETSFVFLASLGLELQKAWEKAGEAI